MADCNPERFMCLWNTSDLNMIMFQFWMCICLQKAYVGLHKICILKKTSSKEE